ncbi:MAG: hypothetical protein HYX86_01825 [Chloroflexi bacterium]|nr:hypothetical protein [Chloroflexota bacterium]
MLRSILFLLAMLLLAAGCGPSGSTTVEGVATFEIVSPAAGASVEGPSITLAMEVQNLTIQPAGGANNPNQGHFHVFVDGGANYDVVYDTTHTLTLAGGEHTLRVELRNNDHSPFSPAVVREVIFTVSGSSEVPAGSATPTPYSYY